MLRPRLQRMARIADTIAPIRGLATGSREASRSSPRLLARSSPFPIVRALPFMKVTQSGRPAHIRHGIRIPDDPAGAGPIELRRGKVAH
jgi:hypothetical protein